MAADKKGAFVVVDGKKCKHYEGLLPATMLFTPDSQSIAYVAKTKEGKHFVVVDTQEEENYYHQIESLTFSEDSRHFAYFANNTSKRFAVVDGIKGKEYDMNLQGVGIVFDPDNKLHYIAKLQNRIYLVESRCGVQPYWWTMS